MSQNFANPLSDVIKVLKELRPQNETCFLSLIQLLGYNFKSRTPELPPSKPAVGPQRKKPPEPEPPSTPERESKSRPRLPVPSELAVSSAAGNEPPDWLRSVPHLEEATPSKIRYRIPLESLFSPLWTRAILSDALSTPGLGGEIDINRIIQEISTAQPLTELPRRQLKTLIRGVQLLVDCS